MAKKKTNQNKSTTKKKTAKKDTKKLTKMECIDDEQARLTKYLERAKRTPVKYKALESDSGKPAITPKDSERYYHLKMFEALGTVDNELQSVLLKQGMDTIRDVSEHGVASKEGIIALNGMMAVLSGIQPQDELEAMLAVQMIGIHNMAMDLMGRATRTDRIDFRSNYMNAATKSLRTFMAQMEALKKYRTGGHQKMVVEHVHVNKGGQAIVGTVNQGGEGNNKNNE